MSKTKHTVGAYEYQSYIMSLPDDFRRRWCYQAPWRILSIRSWVFKRWATVGRRCEDGAIVVHHGWRVLGFRCDTWVTLPGPEAFHKFLHAR